MEKSKCSKCGKCCTNILLLEDQEIKRIKKFIRENDIKCNNKNSIMLASSEGYIDRCPFLSNDNLCMIYEMRPQICRDFKCSTFCDLKNTTETNYEKVKAINMIKTFYPNEYCPCDDSELNLINEKLNNLKDRIKNKK